jgi:hypothetical protein
MEANSMFDQYLKEIKYLKMYILTAGVFLLACYSVVVLSDETTILRLGDEDQIFEWITCFFFVSTSLFFFLSFFKTRKLLFLFLAAVFLFGAGEEISWGQRLIGFETPESIGKINVQKEFNIHNIEIFNNKDLQGNVKNELKKLLDMNFLFKVFVMVFGIILPICVYHIKFISAITLKLAIPVPPVSIGIFFLVSWGIYQLISSTIFADSSNAYFASFVEIFECAQASILAIISFYFFNENKVLITGKDIKQII